MPGSAAACCASTRPRWLLALAFSALSTCHPPSRCCPLTILPLPQYADLPDIEEEEGEGAKARPQGGNAQQPAAAQQGGGGGEGGGAAGDKRSAQAAALEAAQEKQKKAKEAKQAGWFELKINTNV